METTIEINLIVAKNELEEFKKSAEHWQVEITEVRTLYDIYGKEHHNVAVFMKTKDASNLYYLGSSHSTVMSALRYNAASERE